MTFHRRTTFSHGVIVITWLLVALGSFVQSFTTPSQKFGSPWRQQLATKPPVHLFDKSQSSSDESTNTNNDNVEGGDEDETMTLSPADARLSDLLPPTVNFSRDSVLFSENPSTQRNNELLTIWRKIKQFVPPIITGAWSWRDPYLADENPMAAFYNIGFVRLPIIIAGCVYTKNLLTGHPLIMDYGDGPFEMNPIIVYLILAIVLA